MTGHLDILSADEEQSNANTNNCVHWAGTKYHPLASVHLFDAKVTEWCGTGCKLKHLHT